MSKHIQTPRRRSKVALQSPSVKAAVRTFAIPHDDARLHFVVMLKATAPTPESAARAADLADRARRAHRASFLEKYRVAANA